MAPNKRVITDDELKAATRLSPDGAAHIYKIDEKTVLKFGDTVRRAEAETMQLVRRRTSAPVPSIHNVYENKDGQTMIVMDYVPGKNLEDVWDTMSDESKARIIAQLSQHLKEIRSITGAFIGGVDGTPCEDQIFEGKGSESGPYKSEDEFNAGLVKSLKASEEGAWVDIVSDLITKHLQGHEIVLTHNDFTPRNIIVQNDCVTGILDWELSGFFPAYWEYIKALYRPDWQSGWIQERIIDKILRPYLMELAIMMHTRDITW